MAFKFVIMMHDGAAAGGYRRIGYAHTHDAASERARGLDIWLHGEVTCRVEVWSVEKYKSWHESNNIDKNANTRTHLGGMYVQY